MILSALFHAFMCDGIIVRHKHIAYNCNKFCLLEDKHADLVVKSMNTLCIQANNCFKEHVCHSEFHRSIRVHARFYGCITAI